MPQGLSLQGVVAPFASELGATDLTRAMHSVAHTFMADHPPQDVPWNWGEGVLLLGLERAARVSGDPAIDDYVDAYYAHHQQQGVSISWSDDTTPAIALTERLRSGDLSSRDLAKQVVDYVMAAPRSQRQGLLLHLGNTRLPLVRGLFPEVWVDSVFHVVPTLLRYAKISGDARYREEGIKQLLLFAKNLQDPTTGLITHAYNDQASSSGVEPERHVPSFASQSFWARGNGWMLATLVDALQVLPEDHPARPALQKVTLRLGAALRLVQDDSGLFHTLLMRKDTYFESAGSALILYGLSLGASLGVLPEPDPILMKRDRLALLRMLKIEGQRTKVAGTSLGTNPVPALYAITPTADQVSYGVGAWLMAAAQMQSVKPKPQAE